MATRKEDRDLFRRLIQSSELPIAVFSEWVLGVDRTTGQRYLRDGEIPETKKIWLQHVESVTHRGSEVHVVLQWHPANPRWWPYVEQHPRTFARERRGYLDRKDYIS